MPLEDTQKIELYRLMYTAERWEVGLLNMLAEGVVSGIYHAGRGHEGSEAAAVMALDKEDYLLYDHRGCAHLIAKGMDLVMLYGDFLGNDLGSTRGLGAGIVHVCSPELGILGQSGTLGRGQLLASGAALSAKIRKTDQVAMTFFGDGAANLGTFHEAANVAGAWKLPVVFVVQNNGWAVSVPAEYATAGGSHARRGAAYDMPGVSVNGVNPFEVFEAAKEAVERARRGDGPTLIEVKVFRLRGHYEGDPETYLKRESLENDLQRDPLVFVRNQLLETDAISEQDLKVIEEEVRDKVQRAAKAARKGRMPDRSRLFEGLYV